jgi:hypothetical protein
MPRALQIPSLILALMFFCLRAHGQALPTATAPGAYLSVGGTHSQFSIPYGQTHMGGAGLYADVNPRRQVGLEFEARWIDRKEVADVHQSTYLAGPRIQRRVGLFSPYVKVLAGLGEFNFPYNYAQSRNLVIAPGGGLDFNVTERLKVRIVDFEYQHWTDYAYGSYNPYGISAGISFRIFNGSKMEDPRLKQ